MNQDKDEYELDKWDLILSLILVISLLIGCIVVGVLVHEMLENIQLEQNNATIGKSMVI